MYDTTRLPWSRVARLSDDPIQHIAWSAGMIARYIEPLEHASDNRHETLEPRQLIMVPVRLHKSASTLAERFGIDLLQAQIARMGSSN